MRRFLSANSEAHMTTLTKQMVRVRLTRHARLREAQADQIGVGEDGIWMSPEIVGYACGRIELGIVLQPVVGHGERTAPLISQLFAEPLYATDRLPKVSDQCVVICLGVSGVVGDDFFQELGLLVINFNE